MENSIESTKWDIREKLFVAVCLLIMGAVMWRSIHFLSPTFDEPVHTVSGVAHWQKSDTRLNPEHPPLMKVLAALPLVFDVHPDYNSKFFCSQGSCEWLFTRTQFESDRLQEWITRARLPMILITLLTGWVLYAAARRLGGVSGAVLALVVFATSPFFLGYGALVTNDVLLAMMSLLVCMTATDAIFKPGRKTMILLGLAMAGAWLAKFSAVSIIPSLVLA